MATRVLITIDTELTWRPGQDWVDWRANFARSYDPAGVGVPWQLARLAEHDLRACFFVDPMPAEAFGIEAVRAMVAPILAAGQEVQLHLHPNWLGTKDGRTDSAFELTHYDEAAQTALIARARDLLIEAGAPPPMAFRAGSYAANDATLRALAALGLRFDASHNGSHHPDPSAISLPAAQIAPVAHWGVIELPVTQIMDTHGRLRHLQLCAVSATEMRAALAHAARNDHELVSVVSHSFELASRNALRPNRTHVSRFNSLCQTLGTRRKELPTARVADLGDLRLGRQDRPLAAAPLRATRRRAEQLWSNLWHERAA